MLENYRELGAYNGDTSWSCWRYESGSFPFPFDAFVLAAPHADRPAVYLSHGALLAILCVAAVP